MQLLALPGIGCLTAKNIYQLVRLFRAAQNLKAGGFWPEEGFAGSYSLAALLSLEGGNSRERSESKFALSGPEGLTMMIQSPI